MLKEFNPNNMDSKLRKFLVKEKSLFKFIIACHEQEREITIHTKFLSTAINWANTKEKYNYWSKLDTKFRRSL